MTKAAYTAILFGSLCCTNLLCAQPPDKTVLLRDGAMANSIDGTLITTEDTWFFQCRQPLTDGRNTLEPPVRLQLLPSSVLQQLVADANDRIDPQYRIWARLTQYKQHNYLFCVYFLPLARTEQPEPSQPQVPAQPQITSPNDVVTLPPEVAALLQKTEKSRPTRPARQTDIDKDWTLVNRTGRLVTENGAPVFKLDALGQNVSDTTFILLPCEEIEKAEKIQDRATETVRFKVTGIVTTFQNKKYLLLQNVTRVYSNGNFTG